MEFIFRLRYELPFKSSKNYKIFELSCYVEKRVRKTIPKAKAENPEKPNYKIGCLKLLHRIQKKLKTFSWEMFSWGLNQRVKDGGVEGGRGEKIWVILFVFLWRLSVCVSAWEWRAAQIGETNSLLSLSSHTQSPYTGLDLANLLPSGQPHSSH